MPFVGWLCTRRKIEQFCCRKKSEMVWKWSVYGELCLYIVGGCGHILQNTSINTISPDLTLIYDAENGNKRISSKTFLLENLLNHFCKGFQMISRRKNWVKILKSTQIYLLILLPFYRPGLNRSV